MREASVSIFLTLLAYAVLTFVLVGEKPAPAQTEFIAKLLGFLPHAIALVNALALLLLVTGWWLIRHRYVRLHRLAMPSALGLICLFLAMYVTRIYLGGMKAFPGPETVYTYVYLPVLTVHLVLSILCIQPVLYVALIGLTHRIEDIPRTPHKRVARIAVPLWILSLALGLAVYVFLYRIY